MSEKGLFEVLLRLFCPTDVGNLEGGAGGEDCLLKTESEVNEVPAFWMKK